MFLIGAFGSGKTSLLNRYAKGSFCDSVQQTINCDFIQVEYIAKDKTRVKVKLWDTSGCERFVNLLPVHVHYADGLIAVFDLTRQTSYGETAKWIKRAKSKLQHSDRVPMTLVGNKVDLCEATNMSERQVDGEEASQQSSEIFNMRYFETSAMKDINVREMMEHIIECAYQAKQERQREDEQLEVSLDVTLSERNINSFKLKNSLHSASLSR